MNTEKDVENSVIYLILSGWSMHPEANRGRWIYRDRTKNDIALSNWSIAKDKCRHVPLKYFLSSVIIIIIIIFRPYCCDFDIFLSQTICFVTGSICTHIIIIQLTEIFENARGYMNVLFPRLILAIQTLNDYVQFVFD